VFAISFLSVSITEDELYENYLILSAELVCNNTIISVPTMIDTGATGFAFIDKDFTHCYKLQLYKLKQPCHLMVFDGRPILSEAITHLAYLKLIIHSHKEKSPFLITKLGHNPIVLLITWMKYYDVAIRFSSNTVTFDFP
jgi:hypothetical protein